VKHRLGVLRPRPNARSLAFSLQNLRVAPFKPPNPRFVPRKRFSWSELTDRFDALSLLFVLGGVCFSDPRQRRPQLPMKYILWSFTAAAVDFYFQVDFPLPLPRGVSSLKSITSGRRHCLVFSSAAPFAVLVIACPSRILVSGAFLPFLTEGFFSSATLVRAAAFSPYSPSWRGRGAPGPQNDSAVGHRVSSP